MILGFNWDYQPLMSDTGHDKSGYSDRFDPPIPIWSDPTIPLILTHPHEGSVRGPDRGTFSNGPTISFAETSN